MALVNGGFLHYRDMKKFLKNLLLRNCWSDFEIISQEYSLCDPFQKLFAKFWSVYKYGSGEWALFALYGHEEILKKNFFLQNRLSYFEIISQECSLGDPFQKLSAKFWSVNKYGSGEWGLFALYRHEEILKKSCSQKPQVRFWNNFTGMRFWHWQTSRLPDSGRNCYRQAALTICEPAGQVKLLVCYPQLGSLLQIPVVFGLWDLISKWMWNCLQNSFFLKRKWSIEKHGFDGRLIFLLWYKVKCLKTFWLSPFNTTLTKTEYFHWLWKYAMFFWIIWILYVNNFIHVHVKYNIKKKLSSLGVKIWYSETIRKH